MGDGLLMWERLAVAWDGGVDELLGGWAPS